VKRIRVVLAGALLAGAVAACAPPPTDYDPTPPDGACLGYAGDDDLHIVFPPDCVTVQICPPVCGPERNGWHGRSR